MIYVQMNEENDVKIHKKKKKKNQTSVSQVYCPFIKKTSIQ